MAVSKSFLVNSVMVALIAAGAAACAGSDDRTVVTRTGANSYVVCNAYNECWRVHGRYTTYPSDQAIVYRDDAWWTAHQHDSQWRFEADPTDDHGYYDKDGAWHPFGPS
jgi:hypothetical protein